MRQLHFGALYVFKIKHKTPFTREWSELKTVALKSRKMPLRSHGKGSKLCENVTLTTERFENDS